MKRRYQYIEPDKNNNTITVTMNEDVIISTYWNFWKNKMIEKYGKECGLITKENCIKDWITINWALEV